MLKRSCVVVTKKEAGERGTDLAQGIASSGGISAESAGAVGIASHLVTLPAGGRGRPHLHPGHESAIYILSGSVVTWFGERLEDHVIADKGDFVYVPPGLPHVPVNMSSSECAVALVARTDADAAESVILRPDLDEVPHLDSLTR